MADTTVSEETQAKNRQQVIYREIVAAAPQPGFGLTCKYVEGLFDDHPPLREYLYRSISPAITGLVRHGFVEAGKRVPGKPYKVYRVIRTPDARLFSNRGAPVYQGREPSLDLAPTPEPEPLPKVLTDIEKAAKNDGPVTYGSWVKGGERLRDMHKVAIERLEANQRFMAKIHREMIEHLDRHAPPPPPPPPADMSGFTDEEIARENLVRTLKKAKTDVPQ